MVPEETLCASAALTPPSHMTAATPKINHCRTRTA
jgi:hypothetical protein